MKWFITLASIYVIKVENDLNFLFDFFQLKLIFFIFYYYLNQYMKLFNIICTPIHIHTYVPMYVCMYLYCWIVYKYSFRKFTA